MACCLLGIRRVYGGIRNLWVALVVVGYVSIGLRLLDDDVEDDAMSVYFLSQSAGALLDDAERYTETESLDEAAHRAYLAGSLWDLIFNKIPPSRRPADRWAETEAEGECQALALRLSSVWDRLSQTDHPMREHWAHRARYWANMASTLREAEPLPY